MTTFSEYPDYLSSFDLLEQHFRAQLEGLTSTEKGKRFAQFAKRLIPQSEVGAAFQTPEVNQNQSYDEGVDLTAQGKDGDKTLYIQSKLRIDRTDDIDQIISKFQNYSTPDNLNFRYSKRKLIEDNTSS